LDRFEGPLIRSLGLGARSGQCTIEGSPQPFHTVDLAQAEVASVEKHREVTFVNVKWKTKSFSLKLPMKVVNDNFLMYADERKLALSDGSLGTV
jgi:hypothetical protein